jgi:ATP-dependent exoDNAse (exonuclease V) alpha subunit
MTRLIQIAKGNERAVALVEQPQLQFAGFGRALRNRLQVAAAKPALIEVISLA